MYDTPSSEGGRIPPVGVRDGRWLRTCRNWVDEYIATKTVKPVEPNVVPVPVPKLKRQIDAGIKVKKSGIAWRFLQERAKQDQGR